MEKYTTNEDYNPMYAAYALANNMTPEVMLANDRIEWPGGCMCSFILWVAEKKRAFYAACPSAFFDKYTISDLGQWLTFCQAAAKVESAQVH